MRTVLGVTAPTLDDLVQNPSLEEVWINGPDQVFVAPLPAVGLWSVGGVMEVSAHAPLDFAR